MEAVKGFKPVHYLGITGKFILLCFLFSKDISGENQLLHTISSFGLSCLALSCLISASMDCLMASLQAL